MRRIIGRIVLTRSNRFCRNIDNKISTGIFHAALGIDDVTHVYRRSSCLQRHGVRHFMPIACKLSFPFDELHIHDLLVIVEERFESTEGVSRINNTVCSHSRHNAYTIQLGLINERRTIQCYVRHYGINITRTVVVERLINGRYVRNRIRVNGRRTNELALRSVFPFLEREDDVLAVSNATLSTLDNQEKCIECSRLRIERIQIQSCLIRYIQILSVVNRFSPINSIYFEDRIYCIRNTAVVFRQLDAGRIDEQLHTLYEYRSCTQFLHRIHRQRLRGYQRVNLE